MRVCSPMGGTSYLPTCPVSPATDLAERTSALLRSFFLSDGHVVDKCRLSSEVRECYLPNPPVRECTVCGYLSQSRIGKNCIDDSFGAHQIFFPESSACDRPSSDEG